MEKKSKVFIWVDDYRDIDYFSKFNLQDYNKIAVAYNYSEAIELLNYYRDSEIVISLDHDLDFNEIDADKTGYDIAKFIVENSIPIKYFAVHSMNPVGKANIKQLLTHYGYKEV